MFLMLSPDYYRIGCIAYIVALVNGLRYIGCQVSSPPKTGIWCIANAAAFNRDFNWKLRLSGKDAFVRTYRRLKQIMNPIGW